MKQEVSVAKLGISALQGGEDVNVGCKADGTWSAIKASCILSGARTLAGALVPLVGPAPTDFNFVAGDYDRVSGLTGNGSSKYLDTNVAANGPLFPVGNCHIAANGPLSSNIAFGAGGDSKGSVYLAGRYQRLHSSSAVNFATFADSIADFSGLARQATSQIEVVSTSSPMRTISSDTTTPVSGDLLVFTRGAGGWMPASPLSFYSIGEYLDLEALDARVTTLMADIAAALA